jgi:predicted nuclease of predicted toxin-antitoxin system
MKNFFYLASGPKVDFQLVWVRLGNCRTPDLLEAFERIWSTLEASLKAGERITEMR